MGTDTTCMLAKRKHPCFHQCAHPSCVLVLFLYLKANMCIYFTVFHPKHGQLQICKLALLDFEFASTIPGSQTKVPCQKLALPQRLMQ
jgi:hypothetical protein